MRHCIITSLLLCLLVACSVKSMAGDSLLTGRLLSRIDRLQPKEHGVFPKGLFPSYRLYALNKDRQKADVNIFFTGLITFTLRDIKPQLPSSQQRIVDRIIDNTLPVYRKFKNQKGRDTYNFWPTDTPRIFPNAGWMNVMDKSQALPDDLDDTVIMLLALAADKTTARQVHELMQQFTNNGSGHVRNTFKNYRQIGAYSTWFGKKMPVDFDVCVLSNILLLVQTYDLAWTSADSASLQLIADVVKEKKYRTAAAYVAPHYNRLPVILYHLSRLMALKPIPVLDAYKSQLIADAKEALLHADNFMDKIILSTSLYRWGVLPPAVSVETNTLHDLIEDESFSFFIANMASMLPDPLKQWMSSTGAGKFYYFCPAYNNALVLEYLGWKQRMDLPLTPNH